MSFEMFDAKRISHAQSDSRDFAAGGGAALYCKLRSLRRTNGLRKTQCVLRASVRERTGIILDILASAVACGTHTWHDRRNSILIANIGVLRVIRYERHCMQRTADVHERGFVPFVFDANAGPVLP